jgi:radical SAM superfamily enzyme YgiQ (UPF0313 family)
MEETLKKIVGAYGNTPLLGVHLVYLWDKTEEVFNLLSQIKSRNKQIHINLYGYYPTFAFREILQRYPFVDSITLGEPEYPFLELAEAIIRLSQSYGSGRACSASLGAKQVMPNADSLRRTLPLQHIKGLAFRNAEFCAPHSALYTSPDDLPFPDRSLLPIYQEKGLSTYILGSRGCYGRCTFCYVGPFYGWQGHSPRWRGRSPENVYEELHFLYKKGERYFYFADANFFGPGRSGKERAKKLADLIIKGGLEIRFGLECRANDIEKDSLSRLVTAGLREVFLGIESACGHTLKRFKKDTTQEVNRRAIELLRRFGIEPNLGFIMFEPHSRLEDIRTNFEFLKDTSLLRTPAITAHLLSHKQTLFMGTTDYHRFENHNDKGNLTCRPYEAQYDFKDQRVQSFYEASGRLCQGVLSILTQEEAQSSCTSSRPKHGGLSARPKHGGLSACEGNYLLKLNKVLIDTYEKILSLHENGNRLEMALSLTETALRMGTGLKPAPT